MAGSFGGFSSLAGAPQGLQMAYMRDPRLRLAQQLQLQGSDASPVQHWTQGAARLAQALAGNLVQDRTDAQYKQQSEDYQNDMRSLYAPISEFQPGASGAGPRPDAQSVTRAPTVQEILQRGQNIKSPYAQDDLRQFQQLAIQQQAAAEAKKADPMYGRTAVRGVGVVDFRGAQPQVIVAEQRQPDEMERLFIAAGIGPNDPRRAQYAQMMLDNKGRGPQTNVSVNTGASGPQFGPIEKGYMMRQNADGSFEQVPVPGGPAAIEAARRAQVEAEGTRQTAQSGGTVTEDINRAVNAMDKAVLPTTGFMGQMLSGIGGTGARDVAGLLDTIKANTAFDKLAEMRKASPTGAALGSVTERELALLAAVRGNLEQSQSDAQLRYNLARLNNMTLDIVHGPGKGPARMPLPGQGNAAGPRAAAPRAPEAQAPALPPGVTPEMIQAEIARRGLGANR